ncbi:WD repeat domain-containing protein [Xylariomycetidae sp. FL2044]|nr:WD repeat domain-containing protein [Xylariomycetidae sp. FL2044]
MDRPEPGLIKWSPNPVIDTFLHVNLQHRAVQLYEPTGHVQHNRFDYRKLSKFDEIPPLTTYDWSPAHPSFIAIGTASGYVNLLNLDDDSNHYVEQRLKSPRSVHAVAFNTDTLLAVGLERVRNDQCLQVWDINRLANLDRSVSWSSLDGSILGEPVNRLEPATAVSSIKFFEDNPQTLVAGIKNQGIRIYDLRDPHNGVINYHTKCNNNLAIDYCDQNYFASSSLDKPGVVIWDRRAMARPTSSPSYLEAIDTEMLPWGAALGLHRAIELGPNASERGSLIRSLRYCRDHRGLLAVLSRTGQLRVFDNQKEYTPPDMKLEGSPELLETRRSYEFDMDYARDDRKSRQIVSFDWVTFDSPALTPRAVVLRANGTFDILEKPSYTAEHVFKMVPWQAPYRAIDEGSSYHSLMQFDPAKYPDMVGSLLVDGALKDLPIFDINSDYVYPALEEAMRSHPSERDLVEDTEASVVPLPDSFASASSIAEKLRILRQYSKDMQRAEGSLPEGTQHHQTIEDLDRSLTDLSMSSAGPPSNRHLHERLLRSSLTAKGLPKEAQAIVNNTMLLRAKERYLFDYVADRKITSDDPWLRDLWDWIAGADQAALDGGMISQGVDLSFLGVYTLWSDDLGPQRTVRLTEGQGPQDPAAWERCLQMINKRVGGPGYDGVQTKKPAHRQAALRMCGWGRSPNTQFSDYAKTSPSERTSSWHTMAAAQALFGGDSGKAVQILKRASTEYPELLFVSLALQLIGRGDLGLAKEQLDFDDAVASKTDPYLRAISTLIATNDWQTIANQESLPLRERTYVALRYFDDVALTEWLEKEVEKATEAGDIEGILLTGITDQLVDIFAKYIEKFGDVQTATLVLSICSPKYINDYRCLVWRNAYRAYLQRHHAFLQRTKFETESTKKSKRNGVPTIKSSSRQIALRCVYCDAEYELSKMGPGPPSAAQQGQANPLMTTSINAGVSCPNCGRHLPRCVVCLEVVGIPRSDKPEASLDLQTRVAARFPTFCLKCDHVLHLDHARQWFSRHVECPAPECRCRCNFTANPELSYP